MNWKNFPSLEKGWEFNLKSAKKQINREANVKNLEVASLVWGNSFNVLELKLKNLDNLLVCRVDYPFYVVTKTKVEIAGITIELVPQITIVDIVVGI